MKVTPVQKGLIKVRKILASPKAATFAQNTVCAIAVETTLKATGRPAFIYYDKNANAQSKKYAATKEFLYQSFCLGLFLSFIKPVKGFVYDKLSKYQSNKNPENKRKIDLYNSIQSKINKAGSKAEKESLERKFANLLHTNPDYHFGKGLKEFSSIASTVFILALCAPILSQIILHPVMDMLFGKKNKKAQQPAQIQQTSNPQQHIDKNA